MSDGEVAALLVEKLGTMAISVAITLYLTRERVADLRDQLKSEREGRVTAESWIRETCGDLIDVAHEGKNGARP